MLYLLLEYAFELINFIVNKKTSYFDVLEPLNVVNPVKQKEALSEMDEYFQNYKQRQERVLLDLQIQRAKEELFTLEQQRLKILPSVENIALDTICSTKKQSWYAYCFNQGLDTLLDMSGQKDPNSAQALFFKAQFKLQLDYALTEAYSRNIPITEEDFCRLASKVIQNVLLELDTPESRTKLVGAANKIVGVAWQETYNNLYDSTYNNKKVISGVLVTGLFTYLNKNYIKKGYNACAMHLPAPLKKAFPQIFVASVVGVALINMYNLPPRVNDVVITPSQGMVAKAYAKSKSSSFPKDYSTLAGSKRYYSNFSFKEKLKKLLFFSCC